MTTTLDLLNMFSLLLILVLNLLVEFTLQRRGSIPAEELSAIRLGHRLWTANWLAWLLSWYLIYNGYEKTSIVLEDLGGFFLISAAISIFSGANALKRYLMILAAFLVLDCCYLLSVHVLVHEDTSDIAFLEIAKNLPFEQVHPKLTQLINGHTMLFAPSLCIAMLALILVGWALANRSKHFELGIVVGFVGTVYALAQILIYQNGLFVPFMNMGRGTKAFLLVWRILFVIAYWLVTLSAAGIRVAGARIWGVVSTVVAVVTSIIGVILQIRKH